MSQDSPLATPVRGGSSQQFVTPLQPPARRSEQKKNKKLFQQPWKQPHRKVCGPTKKCTGVSGKQKTNTDNFHFAIPICFSKK